jgi:hypothetical protein
MRPVCNRWYADGIARKWGAGVSISNIYKDSQEYFTDMSFGERVEIVARVAYKTARRKATSFSKARQ